MKILLTGASGATGGNLLRSGIFAEHELFYTINKGFPIIKNEAQAQPVFCDLSNRLSVEKLAENFDLVIHVAAVVPKKASADDEYLKNIRMAELLRFFVEKSNVKKVIFISTGSVYGKSFLNKETDVCEPADAYGKSMFEAENIFLKMKNASVTVVRLFYPYAFDEFTRPDNFISRLFQKITAGDKIFIADDAENHFFKPIFLPDFFRVVKKLLQIHYNGVVNVAGDEAVNLPQLLNSISDITNHHAIIQKEINLPVPADADTSLMHTLLPGLQMTSLETGFKNAFENIKKATAAS